MATFGEYAERFARLTPRQTEDRLRVAVALERLPELDVALARGRLPFTAVRELCRVVEPGTERCWLDRTAGLSVGAIQKLVSGREPGDLPDDPPRAQRHRLSFEVGAEVYALFRDAQRMLRADGNGAFTDEDLLRVMARKVLDGPGDGGRSPYQIAMTACPGCGAASQDGAGQPVVVNETALETAFCDAQEIDASGRARQTVPPATRRLVVRRQHDSCAVPGCRLPADEVHHIQPRSEGGTNLESNLAGLCSSHHQVREARARVAAIRTHVGVLGSFDSALRAALAWVPEARTV
jgi:hypothetical protein